MLTATLLFIGVLIIWWIIYTPGMQEEIEERFSFWGEKEPAYEIYPVTEFYKEAKDDETVFQGFFHNTSYADPTRFLANGPQTKSETAKEIAKTINDNKDLTTMMEIYDYTTTHLSHGDGPKFSRTTEEIFASGTVSGCTEWGLAFISIAREKGIPAVFVQTARMDWIHDVVRKQDDMIYGHIFVEVFIDDIWYLIDSTSGRMYLDYDANNFSLNNGYYVFAKSVEVYDTGIEDDEGNSMNMRDLFIHFNEDAYEDPRYQYVDLTTGAVKGVKRVEISEPDRMIAFEDPVFEKTVRDYYDIEAEEITWKDIGYQRELNLEDFKVRGEIANLNDLKWLINLEELILVEAPISGDIASLKTLENLRVLDVSRTDIQGDLSNLGDWRHLEVLVLEDTAVTGDLSDLSGLAGLTDLALNGEWIMGDIASLSDLTLLEGLYLENMNVTGDVGSLNTLVQLRELSLGETDVYGDIGDLSGLDKLEDVEFEDSKVKGRLTMPNGESVDMGE